MHGTINFRSVLNTGCLVDRQCIHIRPQANDLARSISFSLDHTNNTGVPNALNHVITAKSAQLLCNQRAGAMGIEQNFRMLMDVTSPRGDVGVHFGKTVLDGH